MRLIQRITNEKTGDYAKVYFDRDYDEFTVLFFFTGEHIADADYFTDCKQDAIDTAKHTLNIK